MKKESSQIEQEISDVSSLDTLQELIKKNIAWSEAIYAQNKKIQKDLRWMSIMGYVRVAIFLIPIILGIIYLPPILGVVWEQYQSILGIGGGTSLNTDSVRTLLEQFSSN